MKTKFILMIAIAIQAFVLLGCGMVNMLMRTQDLSQHEVTTAYRNENERNISAGMTKIEVIEAWGAPTSHYDLDGYKLAKAQGKAIVDPYCPDDADEFWVYAPIGAEPFLGKQFSYEIYFKGDKVIKIIEQEWTHRLIGPGDL